MHGRNECLKRGRHNMMLLSLQFIPTLSDVDCLFVWFSKWIFVNFCGFYSLRVWLLIETAVKTETNKRETRESNSLSLLSWEQSYSGRTDHMRDTTFAVERHSPSLSIPSCLSFWYTRNGKEDECVRHEHEGLESFCTEQQEKKETDKIGRQIQK